MTGRFLRMSYLVAGVGGRGVLRDVGRCCWASGRAACSKSRPAACRPSIPWPDRERTTRARHLRPRRLRLLPHAADPLPAHRYGAIRRATLAWETLFDYPHLWGTRRIGPDLSREGRYAFAPTGSSRISIRPRTLVPDSVMPALSVLFDGAPDRPRQEARDLVAYLETLGRARELAGPEGEARARAACNCPTTRWRRWRFTRPVLNASPAMARRQGDYPKLAANGDLNRGQQLYLHNCASCHGAARRRRRTGRRWTASAAGESGRARIHAGSPELCRSGTASREPPCRHGAIFRPRICPPSREWCAAFTPRSRSRHFPQNILDLGAHVYAAHCAQCHGEQRRRRRIGRRRVSHRARQLSRRASQPGGEPARAAQRRRRDADGSVDRQT